MAGILSSLFATSKVRTFSTVSTNYPVASGNSLFESIDGLVVKAAGEGANTNLCYKTNIITAPGTWTAGANYPITVSGPFSANWNNKIYGVGGAVVTGVYSTTTAAASWTTEAVLPGTAYWHTTTNYGPNTGIVKVAGFSTRVSTFNGTAWTATTAFPISGAFNGAADIDGRTYIVGSSTSETNTKGNYSSVGYGSWTVETARAYSSRRNHCTNLDGKLTHLGGETMTNIYTYSGTGGTWTVGIATYSTGGSYNITTEPGVAAYGTTGATVWKYS